MRTLGRLLLVATAIAGVARTSSADPLLPVYPSAVVWSVDQNTFRFVGPGFDLTHDIFSFLSIPTIGAGGCAGTDIYGSSVRCSPGQIVDQSVRTPGEVALGTGRATLGNTTYPNVTFQGAFDFRATPAPFPNTSSDSVLLNAPFTFTGMIRGFSNGQEVFAHRLAGNGTTERYFYRLDNGLYSYQMESSVAYFFNRQQATPTPEPASLLLLGTGAAALAIRRRGRTRS